MHEHPVLGAVLFAMGAVLVAVCYAPANAGNDAVTTGLVVGHILALNGVILSVLGTEPIPKRF